jgi:hypothetical protein
MTPRWRSGCWSIAVTSSGAPAPLHHLLLELVPGGAKKDLSAQQARALPATVRPRAPLGCWATSVTSADSPAAPTSPP